jgi:hypothetical protein
MNMLRKCGIHILQNFTEPESRRKICHSQVRGRNWRTSPSVKLARIRRPKATCSLSHVDYRPNINATIL